MVIKISDLLLEAALVEHSNAVAFAGVRVQVDRSWRRALYSVVDEDDKLFPYRVIYVDLQSSAVAYRGRAQVPGNWGNNPDLALDDVPLVVATCAGSHGEKRRENDYVQRLH